MPVTAASREPWRQRLRVPNYRIQEAARYAAVNRNTVTAWHSARRRKIAMLPDREPRAKLSYLELIEVAVVASFRKAGLRLATIREARDYASKQFESEFPFASYKFKTNGKELLADYDQIEGPSHEGKLINLNRNGQLAWDEIIGPRLKEFDYDDSVAMRWRVAGPGSPIIIDPQIAFGAPTIRGVPTWALRGRFESGEPIEDTADDFGIKPADIVTALAFEGLSTSQTSA